MAKITLQILGSTTGQANSIDTVIQGVKANIKELEKPIKITVDTKGIDAAISKLTEASKALGNASGGSNNGAASQMSSLGQAAQQAAPQIQKVSQGLQQLTQVWNGERSGDPAQIIEKYNIGLAKTEQIVSSLNEETGKYDATSTKLTTNYEAQRKAINESVAAYEKYKQELADSAPKTALQEQIEALTGVSTKAKSAEQSMSVFDKAMSNVEAKTIGATDAINESGAASEATAQKLKMQSDAAEILARKNSLLGDSLDRIVAKIVAWQVINASVAALIRSFTDAVSTMQEVDTQLTNIQKVSNLTADEIREIGDAAYSTASKYGVAADEYLSAVYTFQKAGLGESATEMAELATKTMLVGDTTADVASKFLVAVNAAWGLNGSISELSKVVDEADYINNNYATDLEKLSAGMPIVASTAANLNMSIEETLAVLGTITAATQETGTKAATAWRALAMNITGEIGTITDEAGETIEVTEEGVKSITDALKIYGNTAVQTAIETGKVIDPMEAVISLAEAYRDGLLTDIELEDILMSVGGKLRTNQLTALVKDLASETSTYYDIMTKLGDAAGTADSEISIMLSSWESKTQILKNTWTEFVSSFINTDIVKEALDSLTAIINALNTGLGKTVTTIGLIGVALAAVSAMNPTTAAIAAIVLGAGLVLDVIGKIRSETEKTLPVLKELGDLKLAIDGSSRDDTASMDTLYNERAEKIEELAQKRQELADAEQRILEIREEMAGMLDEGGYLTSKEDAEKYAKLNYELQELEGHTATLKDETHEYEIAITAATQKLGGYVPAVEDAGAATSDAADETKRLADELRTAVGVYNDVEGALNPVIQALTELDEEGVVSFKTMDSLLAIYPDLINAVELTADGYVVERSKLEELISAKRAEYELTYNNAVNAAREQISALDGEANAWAMTTEQIKAYLRAKAAAFQASASEARSKTTDIFGNPLEQSLVNRTVVGLVADSMDETAARYLAAIAEIEANEKALSNFDTAVASLYKSLGGGSSSSKSSGGSSSKSQTDTQLQYLKDVVALRESELTLLQASGASEEEQVAKMREIQEALHEEAEYLRSIGASQTDINALSTKWWKLQKDIETATEKIAQTLRNEIADVMQEITDTLKDQAALITDPLQEELDALKAAHDLAQDRREEEEKILAVEEARIALENAQNERNVRQYNAATGQWEWVANAKNVLAAQEALADAEAALSDYYAQAAYDTAVSNLEKQIEYTNTAFDAFKQAWEDATKAIRDGEMSFVEAYAYIRQKMREIYDEYGVDLTDTLREAGLKLLQTLYDLEGISEAQKERLFNAFDAVVGAIDIPIELKEKFVENMERILTAPDIDPELKVRFVETMRNLLSVEDLPISLREQLVNNLMALFNNDELKWEVKDAVLSAFDVLFASGEDAADSIALFSRYIETALQTNNPQTAIEELSNAIRNGVIENINDLDTILRALNGEYDGISSQTAKILALTKMQANSIAWHMTDDEATRQMLHNENIMLGESMGLTFDSASGSWLDSEGNAVYNLSNAGGVWTSTLNSILESIAKLLGADVGGGGSEGGSTGDSRYTPEVNAAIAQIKALSSQWWDYHNAGDDENAARVAAEAYQIGTGMGWTRGSNGVWYWDTAMTDRVFDRGGILRGMGGIKATSQDEMVLPPSLTRQLLNAEATGVFDSLLNHLGIVTSAAGGYISHSRGLNGGIGEQHNGDVFYIDGIMLQNVTQNTSLGELTRIAKNLALVSGG